MKTTLAYLTLLVSTLLLSAPAHAFVTGDNIEKATITILEKTEQQCEERLAIVLKAIEQRGAIIQFETPTKCERIVGGYKLEIMILKF